LVLNLTVVKNRKVYKLERILSIMEAKNNKKDLINLFIVLVFLIFGTIIILEHGFVNTVNSTSSTTINTISTTTNKNTYTTSGTPEVVYTTTNNNIENNNQNKIIITGETIGRFIRGKGTTVSIKEGYFLLNNKLITPGTIMTLETPGKYRFYNYNKPSKSVEIIIN